MGIDDKWLLPEGIEELAPPQAAQLEALRRRLLDCYAGWGYELVMPPFIEYLESLQSGTGEDLDRQTFKLTDPLSGRAIGLRADMTLQAARIDARLLQRNTPVRLCYLGTVLRAFADSFGASRAPLQIGAELYGHAGIESDIEIISLMLETLRLTGLDEVILDLGHVGVYRSLAQAAGLDEEQESRFFDALQRKAVPEINALLDEWQLADDVSRALAALPHLHGGREVLDQARTQLQDFADALAAIDSLARIEAALSGGGTSSLRLHFDLAELRGYRYQTGVVFAAFVDGHGQEIARGGRYDDIGRVFGRARPATGFSADLKVLVALSGALDEKPRSDAILAPAVGNAALDEAIRSLRESGETVIRALPDRDGNEAAPSCARRLVEENGTWVVVQSQG